MSLNVEASDLILPAILSGDNHGFVAGDHVKNQATFTDYYAGYGFYGQLSHFSTNEMFAIKRANVGTMSVTGMPVSLPKTVTLNDGWTFLPCPYQTSVPVAGGVPQFGYAQGDQFKGQSAFTEYYAGHGWYGTLSTTEPGKGYKAKVATGGDATFS